MIHFLPTDKDVYRTDRTLDFYAGEGNKNLVKLHNVLMTYVMYNFDLGYVQGMSDLLSPILMIMNSDEAESFWCFVGFMNRVVSNEIDSPHKLKSNLILFLFLEYKL